MSGSNKNAVRDGKLEEWKIMMWSAGLCGFFGCCSLVLEHVGVGYGWLLGAYILAYLAGGWDALLETVTKIVKGRLDIHFLMLFAAIGAASIGAWWEGVILLFLFSLSHALELMIAARTEREIKSLFNQQPKFAHVIQADGSKQEVKVDDLSIGSVIEILPDHQFPVDGVVLTGSSSVDESTLTGESELVEKHSGCKVFSGTLNTYGPLVIEVEKKASESSHAKIIRLIREAQASKAPSQRFTDRFGTLYTLGIIAFSLLMFFYWHLVLGVPMWESSVQGASAFYRAMTLLVVCSPCALVISIPSAILTGIAVGAKRGILFRGGIALENLARVNKIGMDKTGTLTEGKLEVLSIEPFEDKARILAVAAELSEKSSHPLSRAILNYSRDHLHSSKGDGISEIESVAGKGLQGYLNGKMVKMGKRAFMQEDKLLDAMPNPEPGVTEVIVQWDGLLGRILLRDTLRKEAKDLIRVMQESGIAVAMLTGDRAESAQLVQQELNLKEVRAGLTPEQKVEAIREWKEAKEYVAMVGDGVNDAPSLAMADVSIGMGLRGSDAVLEQADVILMQDRLERVWEAIQLSQECRKIIYQNLTISIIVIVLLALASVSSKMSLPWGVIGHEGSTIFVVLNSLRLFFMRANKTIAIIDHKV